MQYEGEDDLMGGIVVVAGDTPAEQTSNEEEQGPMIDDLIAKFEKDKNEDLLALAQIIKGCMGQKKKMMQKSSTENEEDMQEDESSKS